MTCWDARAGGQAPLVPYALLCLGVYGLGVPALFAYVFVRHARVIRADQRLWMVGHGDTPGANPGYAVRRRYSRLYQVRVSLNLI